MKLIPIIIQSLICPASILFWLPFLVLVAVSLIYWRRSRDFLIAYYDRWTRFSLAIPTMVTLEILAIAIWCFSQEDPGSESIPLRSILCLSLFLLPLAVYQVWRFRGCRLFVFFVQLAQIWVAMSLTFLIILFTTHW